jgi:hypothetical protein
MRIEDEYIAELTSEEKAEYDRVSTSGSATAQKALGAVPSVLQVFQGAPYEFGPVLLSLIKADGGNRAVDAAFRRPPTTEKQLLDPRAYFDHRDPLVVDSPELPSGITETTNGGDLGALSWYILLAQRIDPFTALAAADGWGGDAYSAYKQDGHVCVRATFAGVDDPAGKRMHDALVAWAAAGPAGAASVGDAGGDPQITSCDIGAAMVNDPQRAQQAFAIPVVRAQAMSNAVTEGGADNETAWAFGECLAHSFTFEQYVALNSVSADVTMPPELTAAIAAAQGTCIHQVGG